MKRIKIQSQKVKEEKRSGGSTGKFLARDEESRNSIRDFARDAQPKKAILGSEADYINPVIK